MTSDPECLRHWVHWHVAAYENLYKLDTAIGVP